MGLISIVLFWCISRLRIWFCFLLRMLGRLMLEDLVGVSIVIWYSLRFSGEFIESGLELLLVSLLLIMISEILVLNGLRVMLWLVLVRFLMWLYMLINWLFVVRFL